MDLQLLWCQNLRALDKEYQHFRYLEECGDGVNNTEVEIYLADGPELICAQDWLRSIPTDLQDVAPNGLQLQDLVEKLE
nr:zinc finger, BED-type [Tanacetum cinerariifolium]